MENDLAVSAASGSSRMYVKKDVKGHVALSVGGNYAEEGVKNGTKRTKNIVSTTIWIKK